FEIVDQAVGRSVMCGDFFCRVKFRQDFLRQYLTEFNTPLVETEDVPNHPLYKNLVFIQGYQTAKCTGGELFKQNAVRWSVSFKDTEGCVKCYCFFVHASRCKFGFYILLRFAFH